MEKTNSKPLVLVVDDEKNIRNSVEIALENEGIETIQAHDVSLALRTLNERIVDMVILDIRIGDADGLNFFRRMRGQGYDQPVIFISGHASLREAAEAVKLGGYDFIEKPFNADKISTCVKRCIEHNKMSNHLNQLRTTGVGTEIIGESSSIKKVKNEALKVAQSNASVVILGESGTGKELIANLIHTNSPRNENPFIKVNCSAIPENLIESELFGYEKGAFTGADGTKKGYFELAHRGTIFLDEVADLSLAAQAKVLRVLQEGEIQKLGSEKILKVDVRIVSGTHKDLKKSVADGSFREDLLYRLSVVPLKVPSLRERKEDIPLLIYYYVKKLCERNNLKGKRIDDTAVKAMSSYAWPGNVRELRNVLERVLIMSGDLIKMEDLPEDILETSDLSEPTQSGKTLKEFRDQAERGFITKVLQEYQGNITKAATELGIGRTYLHRRLVQLGIHKKDFLA